MPVTPTYPGVYVEEIPSGVRTNALMNSKATTMQIISAAAVDRPDTRNNGPRTPEFQNGLALKALSSTPVYIPRPTASGITAVKPAAHNTTTSRMPALTSPDKAVRAPA